MTQPRPLEGVQHSYVQVSTPLSLIGIFVAILRERFLESTPSDPELKWHWVDDLKSTEIFIESGFNENMEARNTRPGIWVDRDQTSYGKVSIGDQDRIPTVIRVQHETFYATAETDMVIECTAVKRGESMIVGSIVQDFLQMSSNIVQAYFGLRDISPIVLNRTVPYEKDRALMSTQVVFRVQYEARWATMPIGVVLSGITSRIADVTDPELYFRNITLRDN